MTKLVVGPFNRVEGDLEVTLDIAEGVVQAAYANSPLYRGFEQILRGKEPTDALVFAPRICGICSVSQSAAAAYALADAMGLAAAENGRITRNLATAVENVADHLTHFYLFFMPDFARDCYAPRAWHAGAARRFRAIHGTATADALPARAGLLGAMGTLAGKWPHTLAVQPGGSSRALEAAEKVRLYGILRDFRRFLETALYGDALETVAALDSAAALERWAGEKARGDFGLFLEIAEDLRLAQLGPGPGRYLSYGAYVSADGGHFFRRGVWDGALRGLDADEITEDASRSWLGGPSEPLPPARGVTLPLADKAGGYSWCKAPRLAGQPFEVGALARQMIDGHPLVRDLAQPGSNVHNRVVARLLEIARVVPAMEDWVRELVPGERFCSHGTLPRNAQGMGLTEAARGSLGHWLSIADGRIANYQIVSPTTWNFSPRDAHGMPGPLEQALVGAAVRQGESMPVAVQHIVRSFDPCMVCTVH